MKRSIQAKIFINYTAFILVLIIIFTLSIYIYISSSLEKKSSESLLSMSASISTQLDSELRPMNSIITRIWYSNTLKDLFFSNIYTLNSESISKQRALNDVILSIIGPDFNIHKVNIMSINGNYYSIGSSYNFSNIGTTYLNDLSWFKEVLSLEGKRVIFPPHADSLIPSDETVISMCKSFTSDFSKTPDTIIEVQLDYNKIISLLKNSVAMSPLSLEDKNIIIFDDKGNIIYPLNKIQESQYYIDSIKTSAINKSTATSIKNPITGDKEYLSYYKSDFSNWTVVISESESILLESVNTFRVYSILGLIIILALSLLLSYLVSSTLSRPIKIMHKGINNISLDSLTSKSSLKIDSDIIELEELNQAFADMCKKLESALEQVVLSRSQEIHARLLALQSQMNPHFLYNIISNISAMAEEGNISEIATTCISLSKMLRYISCDSNNSVSLRQEVEHTKNFVGLMKIRFEDKLSFNNDISDEILDCTIPRLVIQPLVENCTKYGADDNSEWHISVVGTKTASKWIIRVSDTGSGFDNEYLKSLSEQIRTLDILNNSLNLCIDGMGLINIFVRLKLLYGNSAIFNAGNLAMGGAFIEIGGPLQNSLINNTSEE